MHEIRLIRHDRRYWITRLLIGIKCHTFIHDIIFRGIIPRKCPPFYKTLLLQLYGTIFLRIMHFLLLFLRRKLWLHQTGIKLWCLTWYFLELPLIFVGIPSSFLRPFARLLLDLIFNRDIFSLTYVILRKRGLYYWYFGFEHLCFCIPISIQAPFSPLSYNIFILFPDRRTLFNGWFNSLRLIFDDEPYILTALNLIIMNYILLLNMSLARCERSLHRSEWFNWAGPFLEWIFKGR